MQFGSDLVLCHCHWAQSLRLPLLTLSPGSSCSHRCHRSLSELHVSAPSLPELIPCSTSPPGCYSVPNPRTVLVCARSRAWTRTCLGQLGKQISKQALQGGKFHKQRVFKRPWVARVEYIPEVLFVILKKCT